MDMGQVRDMTGRAHFPTHTTVGRGWQAWRIYVAGAAAVEANTNAAAGEAQAGMCTKCSGAGQGATERDTLAHHLGRCKSAAAVDARTTYTAAVAPAGREFGSSRWTNDEVAAVLADIDSDDVAGGGRTVAWHTSKYLWELFTSSFGTIAPRGIPARARGRGAVAAASASAAT